MIDFELSFDLLVFNQYSSTGQNLNTDLLGVEEVPFSWALGCKWQRCGSLTFSVQTSYRWRSHGSTRQHTSRRTETAEGQTHTLSDAHAQ